MLAFQLKRSDVSFASLLSTAARNVGVLEAAQIPRKINIGRTIELVANKQKKLERQTRARRAKAKVKARARTRVKTKVRRERTTRRRKPTQRLVWTRSEQQQLETAKGYFLGIVSLWTVGPTCGSNTRKTNR